MTKLLIILLLIVGCQEPEENISGCPNVDSCNYNVDATDEENCWYANDGCLCLDGNGATVDECNVCNGDNSTCSDCAGVPNGNSSISTIEDLDIQVIVSIWPWHSLPIISDSLNYFGVKSDASDEFDSLYDIPEPPGSPGYNIDLYFPHADWDYTLGGEEWSKFTSDYKSNEICNFKEWNFIVKANTWGSGQLSFKYLYVPDNLVIELVSDEGLIPIEDEILIDISLDSNMEKEFVIKVSTN